MMRKSRSGRGNGREKSEASGFGNPPRNTEGRRRGSSGGSRRKGWLWTGAATLVLAGAVGVGTAYVYGSEDTLPEGVTVGGLAVGGQSADAAIRQVRARAAEIESTSLTLGETGGVRKSSNGKTADKRTLKQLGLRVETDEAVHELEKFSEAPWWERARLRLSGGMEREYAVGVTWDEAALKREITAAWGGLVSGKPVNAKRTIDANDRVVYTPEQAGTALDVAAIVKQAKALAPVSLAEGGGAGSGGGAGGTDTGSGTNGNSAGSGGTVHMLQLAVVETLPEVTVDKLKDEGIERKIAEFTTSFTTSGAGRSHNVTVAAKALNDTLLQPDEVFEYGKIVSKAEKDYGYQEAPVIVQGKLTPGIGGGICQVSSTLYNAILEAGLEVVERRNHSLVVHYLPPGLDATFAEGYVNFRFRNSTGKQLLIRTVVENKRLTVKLFGTMPDNVAYETETEQIKVVPPKTKYVANAKLPLGEHDRLQKGEPGYVVDTYRLKYVDGKLVERKKLGRSSYRSQDELVAVHPDDPLLKPGGGTTPSPTPAPEQPGDEGPVEPV